jgi:hypothetical protein
MPDSELQDGWEVEGYWTGIGEGHGEYHDLEGETMSESDFMEADRIVLSHLDDDGEIEYYTIGEVEDYDSIYDIIEHELDYG